MENPAKMDDDWGDPYFWKHPYTHTDQTTKDVASHSGTNMIQYLIQIIETSRLFITTWGDEVWNP